MTGTGGSRHERKGHGRDAATAAFEATRPRLWSLAYRMLGSAADAEDAVQSTWLKWQGADTASIERPEAWLVTACTRLCLDLRRAADRARVDYVGAWLPEPVASDPILAEPLLARRPPSPAERAELASSLTVAFLHLLERLSPAERAAYLLREIFDYDYAEVAAILARNEPACRQLVARARRALAGERRTQPLPPPRQQALLASFFEALESGDAGRLEALLAEGVEAWSDSGGKATAASRVVRGRRAVARLLLGLWRRYWNREILQPARLNGEDALVIRDAGRIVGTLSFAADPEGRWLRVLIQRNPDKLRHLQ